MPKSFLGLIAEAQRGAGGYDFHLCDPVLFDLKSSLATDDVIWLHSLVSTEPTGAHYSPSSATFFRLDENGKHQFCVKFPNGATQVLATEP